ncbi:MAG: hypothetical protein V1869_05695 [Candidatus Omnitrophota bacterium]
MKKTGILTALLVLLMVPAAWAGDNVTISMSCTIPSIPGVNAPPNIPEAAIRNYQREDVANKNAVSAQREEVIEKYDKKESTPAQGKKVTTEIKTIYTR